MANYASTIAKWAKANPDATASLAGSAMTLAGGAMAGKGQQKATEAELQIAKDRLAFDRERTAQDRAVTQAKNAGDLVGNPLQDQARRNQLSMMRQAMLGNLNTSVAPPAHLAGYTGSVTMPTLTDAQMPFLQPGAMAAAEAPKWNVINGMAPGTMSSQGLSNMGYGDAAAQQAALTNAVGGSGAAQQAQPKAPRSPEESFNANYDAIKAAKAQTGDWEKAYQQVTGETWPKGQGIKIDDAGGHMTKDRSKWKTAANMALTVAPIAAAPFTGGASLALIGAGAGAAKGLLNGGGAKGALLGGAIGAAGSLGGGAGGKVPFSMGALGKQLASPKMLGAAATQLGGTVGELANIATPFLPGATFNQPMSEVPGAGAITGFRGNLPGSGAALDLPVPSSVGPLAGGYGMPVGGSPPASLAANAAPKAAGRGITAKAVANALSGGQSPSGERVSDNRVAGGPGPLAPMRPVPSHGAPSAPLPSAPPFPAPAPWSTLPTASHGAAQGPMGMPPTASYGAAPGPMGTPPPNTTMRRSGGNPSVRGITDPSSVRVTPGVPGAPAPRSQAGMLPNSIMAQQLLPFLQRMQPDYSGYQIDPASQWQWDARLGRLVRTKDAWGNNTLRNDIPLIPEGQ